MVFNKHGICFPVEFGIEPDYFFALKHVWGVYQWQSWHNGSETNRLLQSRLLFAMSHPTMQDKELLG
jgi:hypothetical protein